MFTESAFEPTGELVQRIIHDTQLRAPDVSFLYENPMDLRGIEHTVDGINVLAGRTEGFDAWRAEQLDI